jgi:GNAT superfamily N-acetyltransferase
MKDRWVGICGVTIDPYLEDARVGRLRNVYVLADCRRTGIGRRLVEEALALADGHFDRLRLRAVDDGPARLYESLGFRRCQGIANCTHIINFI